MNSEGDPGDTDRIVVASEEVLFRLRSSPSSLRRSSVRFLLAYSGSEALSLARASAPAVVLIDFALPVLRADQVCRELKASPKLRDIPVVIAGPALPPEFEAACRAAGATAYFHTPLDLAALASFLAGLLRIPDRADPRFPVLLSVSYGTITSQSLGRSRDLSLSGIQVRTSARFRKGFNIHLRFPVNEECSIVTAGRVMRCTPTDEGEYDLGIHFVGLTGETRARLVDFLARQRS